MFSGQTIGFLLAQSVFTHLLSDFSEACFRHVKAIMTAGSRFFFTHGLGDDLGRKGLRIYAQLWSFQEGLTDRHSSEKAPWPEGRP